MNNDITRLYNERKIYTFNWIMITTHARDAQKDRTKDRNYSFIRYYQKQLSYRRRRRRRGEIDHSRACCNYV